MVAVEEQATGQTVFANTANNVSAVLAVAMAVSDTTLSLTPGGGALFPNAPFYCSCEFEVLWCLSKSGDTLTIQRGFDGTTASAHAIGQSIEMRNNAGLWNDAYHAINSVSGDVTNLTSNISNKSALPPDVVYTANTVELTHKTIDLTDSAKANVIIGNVAPDPTQLVYPNITYNGGFDNWGGYPNSTTLAAGTPTAGASSAIICNGWGASKANDSSITATKDSANTDPTFPSGTDCLLNITTVQGTDYASLYQQLVLSSGEFSSLVNNLLSTGARIKLVSGTMQFRYQLSYNDSAGAGHVLNGPQTQLVSGWQTMKFENQIAVPAAGQQTLQLGLQFQGVGVIAVDNVMTVIGTAAAKYYPRFQQHNQDLASDVARANLLVNGGFEIWQRGSAFGANNQYAADRWLMFIQGTDAFSVSLDSTNVDIGSLHCAFLSFTLGTGGGLTRLQQEIKTVDGNQVAGKTVSFSIRAKTTLANSLRIGIGSDGTGGTTVYSPNYHTGNGIYQTLSVTYTVPANATNLVTSIFLSAGTAQAFYVDNAMLVIGQIPADYVPMHPADELARCQRYYQRIGAGQMGVGYVNAASQVIAQVPLKATMAIVPSTTTSSPLSNLVISSASLIVSLTSIAQYQGLADTVSLTLGVSGMTAGQGCMLRASTASDYLNFEANP
jgi:hypothetical protein